MRKRSQWCLGLICLLLPSLLMAAVPIPKPLQPWQNWALKDQPDFPCPFYYQSFQQRQCQWPGQLSLNITSAGVQFDQQWQLFRPGTVPLPGGEGFWPESVAVNGKPGLLTARGDRPLLQLEAGTALVSGFIPWQAVPESLLLPMDVALVQLQRDGVLTALPALDADGRLWLSRRKDDAAARGDASLLNEAEDKLTVRVYRRLLDDVPFQMETRVDLEVAGKAREVTLGKILFDQFVPRALSSPLPARIEADGRLRIQLRPGQWHLQLQAHRIGAVDKLFFETSEQGFWPEEEIWAFEARPALRQVRIEGVESLDPAQTSLPMEWRNLPAYHVQAGQAMTLLELRRGDPQPSPNQLRVYRDLWLDFNGAGVTVRDRIEGSMFRDWRLQVDPAMALGSLTLNGEPQVITLNDGQLGVEVRNSRLQAEALSRLTMKADSHKQQWSAVGWQHDVEWLDTTVHLPPGWRLLLASGMEKSTNSWVDSWNVWDLFMVLITVAAMLRLSGIPAAVVTGGALLLIYPEANEFLYLLLNIIAVTALLMLLPAGRLKKLLNLYCGVSLLVLVIWLLGFMVEQARLGLYPQLEQPWNEMGQDAPYSARTNRAADDFGVADVAEEVMTLAAESAPLSRTPEAPPAKANIKAKRYSEYDSSAQSSPARLDPGLAAQTGPGLPGWSWNQAQLSWSGPVTAAENITLWLLDPMENRILSWLRALLALLIIVVVLGLAKGTGQRIGSWLRPVTASAALLLPALLPMAMALLLLVPAGPAQAEIPDKAMLEELAKVQLQAQNCTPSCVAIQKTSIDLHEQRLTAIFNVHARQPVYWNLPDSQQQWHIDGVLLDAAVQGTRRMGGSTLAVLVPAGEHQLTVTGSVNQAQPLQLAFSLVPHNISVRSPGYQVRGLDNGRLSGDSLYFTPLNKGQPTPAQEQTQLTPDPIQPFVLVERTFRLGLNWYMETRVTRVAPGDGGISLDVPLVPGESVTSREVEVHDGKARVVLEPGMQQLVWYSALEKTSLLTLTAAETSHWAEQWQIDISPLWHLQYEGLVPIKKAVNSQGWQPRWQPLPGESLTLNLNRPQALEGSTKTVDSVLQEWEPGLRESRGRLRLHVINSKGVEQRLQLPADALVKSVRVDNELRAVDEQNPLLIIPVNPGQHWLEVEWREPTGVDWISHTPVVQIEDEYVNHRLQVTVPANRWVLFVGGPSMGPAILFWGMLLVLILVGIGLGRVRSLPLRSWHWVILMVGLCAGQVETVVMVVLWFFLIQQRTRPWVQNLSRLRFNLLQVVIVGYSLLTLGLLLTAIPQGLIGSPDMGVTGNGSSQYLLNWFVDRGSDALQSAWFVSVPVWSYRALMLIWSLWLVVYILRWLKWAWAAFTEGGHWRAKVAAPETSDQEQE